MPLKTTLGKTSQKDFDIISQTEYSSRLDVCQLKQKTTGERYVGLVLKEKDSHKRQEFFNKRKHSEELRAFVADGYQGDTFLPETFLGKGDMILTPYAGEYLKDELYNSLSTEEKEKALKDLATFLNHMHQKAFSDNKFLKKIPYFERFHDIQPMTPLCSNLDANLDAILEIWKNTADKKVLTHLIQLVKAFKKRDKSDEKSVLIHNDICDDNVLYDKRTKKLAVIDFEYSRIGNIYDDFCHFGGLVFPREFITGVVKEYNKLTKKSKHPCPISMKKLEIFWEVATLNNQACWVKEWGRSPEDAYKIFIKNISKLKNSTQKEKAPTLQKTLGKHCVRKTPCQRTR